MGKQITLDYGEIDVSDKVRNIEVGDRSVELFLDPRFFPMNVDGMIVNLFIKYGTSVELMEVRRRDPGMVTRGVVSERINIFEMTKYQKMLTFLYLLGDVMPDGNH